MKSNEYWRKRFELLEESQNNIGLQCYADIEKQYRQAQKQLESQIATWYQRFASNNKITIQESHRLLNSKELIELKWDIKDYIQHGKENVKNGAWIKQLENASAKYHISRLESLKLQIQQNLEVMFGNQLDSIDYAMRNIYKNGYYHTAYEIQKGIGFGWNFSTLDDRKILKVINNPWATDGKDFSERIWGNREKLVNELNTAVTQNIILGEDPQKAIDKITHKMKVSKNVAGRLVMTEEAFFSSAAQKDCFKELNVEEYEIVATLDSHTSEMCRQLDGKHFPMSKYEVGITAPPFHCWCRSTTAPYFDDEFDNFSKRAARGEYGKTYYVPANINYDQWYKEYVEKTKEHVKIELTDLEQGALNKYLSFDSYLINESLRNNTPLSTVQQDIVKELDMALSKIPTYTGNLSRSLEFQTEEEVNWYLKRFTLDGEVTFKEYISTTSSEQGYNPSGQVQIFIQNTKQGHDLILYNRKESEVLYDRGSSFKVLNIAKKGNKHYILLEEM